MIDLQVQCGTVDGRVLLSFDGQAVTFLCLTPDQAKSLARTLWHHAEAAEGNEPPAPDLTVKRPRKPESKYGTCRACSKPAAYLYNRDKNLPSCGAPRCEEKIRRAMAAAVTRS